MMKATENKLKTGSIPKLVLSYALTTLTALLLNSVYNLTDTLFVSWGVGVNASGAVSVVLPFVLIQSAISTALGGGAAALVSIKLGESKKDEAGEITLNAMIAFYTTAILVSIIGFFLMDYLLPAMGVTDELYNYSKDYFIIILFGNVFSTGFSSIIRAEGKMLYALLIWVIPITVNIIFDAIFIFVLGLGIKGSAYATVICQFTSFSMMVIFFLRFSSLDFKGARFKWKRVLDILKMGIPSLVQIGSMSLMILIINNVLSKVGGTLGVNTFAFVNKLIGIAIVPFTALAQAIAPIIGYNYGAKDNKRVKNTVKFTIIASLCYAVFATVIAEVIPSYLMRIFTTDINVINSGATAIRILALATLFIPLPLIMGVAYQAQDKKAAALVLYILNLLFLLPFVFTLHIPLGIAGVWLSYVLASICATVLTVILYTLKKRKISSDM